MREGFNINLILSAWEGLTWKHITSSPHEKARKALPENTSSYCFFAARERLYLKTHQATASSPHEGSYVDNIKQRCRWININILLAKLRIYYLEKPEYQNYTYFSGDVQRCRCITSTSYFLPSSEFSTLRNLSIKTKPIFLVMCKDTGG